MMHVTSFTRLGVEFTNVRPQECRALKVVPSSPRKIHPGTQIRGDGERCRCMSMFKQTRRRTVEHSAIPLKLSDLLRKDPNWRESQEFVSRVRAIFCLPPLEDRDLKGAQVDKLAGLLADYADEDTDTLKLLDEVRSE